jgi:predicted YcjX-like family ATPase
MTEVKKSGTLSLGLVDYDNSWYVDYPIPSNTSTEYSYFFFKLLVNLIKNSATMVEQDFYEVPKKRIKRLRFFTAILRKKKHKFKITNSL